MQYINLDVDTFCHEISHISALLFVVYAVSLIIEKELPLISAKLFISTFEFGSYSLLQIMNFMLYFNMHTLYLKILPLNLIHCLSV